MAKQTLLNGLKELRSYLSTIQSGNSSSVFILFTGSKDAQTGQSWCPDCNVADPVVHNSLKYLNTNSEFITCIVGDKPTWKDPNNELRHDKEFQLKAIPTLVQWKKHNKLVEEQCADESLVKMLFQEEDD